MGTTTKFAAGTEVPIAQSKQEIEKLLMRYGATEFVSGWKDGEARIAFVANDRQIRFVLPLPGADDPMFRPRRPHHAQRVKAAEGEARRRWRALALVIKAKLEAVASGVSTFEQEFLANIVLPGSAGRTLGEWAAPQLAAAYENNAPMPLLGAAS